jgi:hypothetical protein
MSEVKTRRVVPANEHERQKWLVLEGYVEGIPAVTKRTSIAVAALVSRPALLDEAREKLIADVTEYHQNYLALQELG